MSLFTGNGCLNLSNKFTTALLLVVTTSLLMLSAVSARADLSEITADLSEITADSSHVYFQTSLYTEHFTPKPEHNNHQGLIDLQWHWKSKYFVGFSYFRNSFAQPTNYFYVGHEWDIPNTNNLLYASLTGGLAHGYDGEKKDEIPFNKHGVAPIILPLVGIRYNNIHSQFILFGTSGYTLTAGIDIPL